MALSTQLTPELILEGVARDTIRHIQERRKTLQLEVTDRIEVHLWQLGASVEQAVGVHRERIQQEVLAHSFCLEKPSWDEEGQAVTLGKEGEGFRLALRKALVEIVS